MISHNIKFNFNHPLREVLIGGIKKLRRDYILEQIIIKSWKFKYNKCVREIEIIGLTPPNGKIYLELIKEYSN